MCSTVGGLLFAVSQALFVYLFVGHRHAEAHNDLTTHAQISSVLALIFIFSACYSAKQFENNYIPSLRR